MIHKRQTLQPRHGIKNGNHFGLNNQMRLKLDVELDFPLKKKFLKMHGHSFSQDLFSCSRFFKQLFPALQGIYLTNIVFGLHALNI